jgi:hypothetical protein
MSTETGKLYLGAREYLLHLGIGLELHQRTESANDRPVGSFGRADTGSIAATAGPNARHPDRVHRGAEVTAMIAADRRMRAGARTVAM